jgi:cysteinyl-tRNA synthetase
MAQAEEALRRLTDFLARLESLPARPASAAVVERLAAGRQAFGEAIASDLNTSGALAAVFDLVRELNTAIDAGELGADDGKAIKETFDQFDRVLGVLALRKAEDEHPPVPVEEIERLITARRDARLARNFAEADRIRKELLEQGIVLKDSPTGTTWEAS